MLKNTLIYLRYELLRNVIVNVYFRSLAPENWNLVNSTTGIRSFFLQNAPASTNAFCVFNPVTLNSLGGTLTNTLSASSIASSSMMTNTLNTVFTRSDFTAASWTSYGWDVESIEIFKSQLKTWVDNNFKKGTVLNVGSDSINVYIVEVVRINVRHVIPVIYVGNTGSLVSNVTQDISLTYTTPLYNYLNTMSGNVTDNGSGVGGVTVTATIKTFGGVTVETQTATSASGTGAFTINFTGYFANYYYLLWSGTVNGQQINKTRVIQVIATPAASTKTITYSPDPAIAGSSFTATITVRDQYSNLLSNQSTSLTYNGTTQSGTTDGSGQFQATFTANASATSISYDVANGRLTGSQAITVQDSSVSQVTISQAPNPAIDGNVFTLTATVLNSQSSPLSGKSISLTYNNATQTGTTDSYGVYSPGFNAAYGVTTVNYSVDGGAFTGSTSIFVSGASQTLTSITLGSPSPSSVDTSGSFSITAYAYDQYSVAMSAQTITIYDDSLNSLGYGITDGTGAVTITCTAPGTAGNYTLTAKSGSVSSSTQALTVTNPTPVVTTISLSSPSSSPIYQSGNTSFTATVYDQFNQVMQNVYVEFHNAADNSLEGSATTNSSGEAVFTYYPMSTGAINFYAKVGSVISNWSGVNVNANPALSSITLGSPSPGTLKTGETFTVSVDTYDQYYNPYGGVLVEIDDSFSILGSDTTDGSGNAIIYCTAATVGSLTIVGRSGSVTSSSRNLTVTASPTVTTLNIGSPSPSTVNVGDSFTVLVDAYDQYSSGIGGVSVEIYDGTSVLGSGTTDVSGNVSISCTAANSGSLTIVARSGSVTSSGTNLTVNSGGGGGGGNPPEITFALAENISEFEGKITGYYNGTADTWMVERFVGVFWEYYSSGVASGSPVEVTGITRNGGTQYFRISFSNTYGSSDTWSVTFFT